MRERESERNRVCVRERERGRKMSNRKRNESTMLLSIKEEFLNRVRNI